MQVRVVKDQEMGEVQSRTTPKTHSEGLCAPCHFHGGSVWLWCVSVCV